MSFKISEEAVQKLHSIMERYPDKKSAVMPALYLVQEENGCIDDAGVKWVSEQTGISPVHVLELVTFYTMYRRKPVGKYHVQVCRTLSCALCGAAKLTKHLHEKLGVEAGEVTSDGLFSYEQVECLGSCGSAPMVEINDRYFENLNVDKLGELLDLLKNEQPDLSLSTKSETLGEGASQYPLSEVYGEVRKS